MNITIKQQIINEILKGGKDSRLNIDSFMFLNPHDDVRKFRSYVGQLLNNWHSSGAIRWVATFPDETVLDVRNKTFKLTDESLFAKKTSYAIEKSSNSWSGLVRR
jgi:hypothetical protein